MIQTLNQRVFLPAFFVGSLTVGSVHAAQFNFFFTSESDPSTSTPQAALHSRSNPTVRAGAQHELTLWLAVDPSVVPAGQGLTGAWLDLGETGSQAYGSALIPYNPNNRWNLQSTPGGPGRPGYTHQWLLLGTLGTWLGPRGATPDLLIDNFWVYRLASGSFLANGPGGLFLEIPFLGSVGYSDSASWDPSNPSWNSTSGGASFGFDNGAFDIQATAHDYFDPSHVVSVPYRNGDPAQGFLADGVAFDGAIRTTTPDVIVINATNPEPATLVLLGLGTTFFVRRRT